jgi:TRAP-type C4-dicarboxylate transport system substrate-binding protein
VSMDDDLQRIIRQALDDAQAAGRDHVTQTEEAVRAVLQARPNLTAPDALSAVNLLRRQ